MTVAHDVELHARRLIDRLDLPESERTLDGLVSRAASVYGKPIYVQPLDVATLRATGLWLEFEDRGVVLYRGTDPKPYQRFSILHELAHAISGHTGCDLQPHELVGPITGARTVRARVPRTDVSTDSVSAETFDELVAEETAYGLLRWLVARPRSSAEDAFA